jgi:glycogen debranching enzyme
MTNITLNNTTAQDLIKVLDDNWRDGYTIPSARLYPFQWNWDAGFIALGLSYYAPEKAMEEIRYMFKGQWSNGMLPHIVFHQLNENYFPGPEIWQVQTSQYAATSIHTSGITQPPVFGFILERMHAHMSSQKDWHAFLEEIYPKVYAFHKYLYTHRDPYNEGLVYIQHNWESGTDNSPMWDDIFENMDISTARDVSHLRKDNKNVDASERPTDENYKRYINLIDRFVACNYDDAVISKECPFLVQDVLFNSMLVKSNHGLIKIGKLLGKDVSELQAWNQKSIQSINSKLWDEASGFYYAFDLKNNKRIPIKVSSGFMPLFADVASKVQAARIVDHLFSSFQKTKDWYLCTSCAHTEASFNPVKYWRGPVWINVNWMLYHGLQAYGFTNEANRIKQDSLVLIEQFGSFEYFDPRPSEEVENKRGIGADLFSWTAALYLDFTMNEQNF